MKIAPANDKQATEFAVAIDTAIEKTRQDIVGRGETVTINALIGAMIEIMAFMLSKVDEGPARKALRKSIERDLATRTAAWQGRKAQRDDPVVVTVDLNAVKH